MVVLILLFVITTNSFVFNNETVCESNITSSLRQFITEFHNKIRSNLARGYIEGYENGTNIYALKWDCELEKLAHERANSCTTSRELDRFAEKIGESIYEQNRNESKNNGDYFYKALIHWLKLNSSRNQIIFGQTLLVGCGINECQKVDAKNKVIQEMFLVCQYWPIAKKGELYKTGYICESSRDCTTYKGSVCKLDTKLCDLRSEAEIQNSFHTLLASNVIAQLCNKKIMGDDIRNDILFEHNLFRSQLAHGNIEFFSSGSNIYSLKWSCELERLAQRYADACIMSRNQDVSYETGQNAFKIKTDGNSSTDYWLDEAFNFWENENTESQEIAQILYGKTLLVGCGIHKCPGMEVIVVCQYWPKATPGPLYQQGPSCETDDYCDAYNQSSCQAEMGLCQIPDHFAFPDPFYAVELQTTPITDVRTTEDANFTAEKVSNSSESSEKIIEDNEKQYCGSDTKLLNTHRSLLKKKHEEYRKKLANGAVLRNFASIEEDLLFELYWNCELEREAQREAEKCAMPPREAECNYYRANIYNFEFNNLSIFLEQKIDQAIRNWWGNANNIDHLYNTRFEARSIGCGISICVGNNLQMVFDIVCRYSQMSDPYLLYSSTISCATDEDCGSLPNSFCDVDLRICST